MKKKLGKSLAAMLTVTMLAGSLTACGGDTGDGQTSETPVSDEAQETSGNEEAADSSSGGEVTAEEILARDFSEKIDISFAGVQCDDTLDYNQGNEYYSWWTDTFNVEWDVTSLTFANWVERMNVWINADDLPDWSVWNFTPGDAASYVDQELVKRMPDDWREKYPNLAKASEWSPANAYYEELYGGMYFFFRPVMANNFPADIVTNHISAFLRTDWAEQADYDLSKNMESGTISISEFLAYCQAVKDAGITEYPWYNTSAYALFLMDRATDCSGIGQTVYYKGDDGQYHWGPGEESSGVKEGLRQIKEAYDNGLLYPEFYTLQGEDDLGHFIASGDAAAVICNGMASYFDRCDREMQENLGVDFWEDVGVFVLTDDNGAAHEVPATNFWACNIISPNVDDETLERILSIWDYGCTEEGQLRIRCGIPEVDWKFDESGNVVSLIEEQGFATLEEKYTSLYPITGNMFILSDDYSFISPVFTQQAKDKVAELYLKRAEIVSSRGEEVDWDLNGYSSQALNLATVTYADEYSNIITREGDFDTNYDQWVADRMQMIQPVLDELNEAFGE